MRGAPAAPPTDALSGRLREALVRIVGADAVVTEPGRLLSWETDALTRFRELPRGVVLPRTTREVSDVVRLLAEAGIPLTPRGAGTGLSGGSVASPGGVLVGTSRMTRILSLDPERRLARVEAGVINTELSRVAAPHGLHYAPDPSSQAACTLGGNVGENAGGPHCLKYGVTTRYVTGLTVVTGSGEIVELGGADRCPPLDLVGLFVGSEGLLGLATEIEVRLVPRPRGARTLLAVFPSTESAGEAVSAIIADGLVPAAMEIMDRGTIQAVEASVFAAGYPTDAGAVLVVEFDGVPEGLPEEAERAAALCTDAGATRVRTAEDEAERENLWQGRKKAYGAFGRITPDLMVQDATVPRSTLPRVLRRIDGIGEKYGLRLANVFHAGDGNLHPKILYDRRDPELVERVERASREIMQVCVDAGGTITGEHGVGLDKRDYMALVHGPGELAAMRRVQEAFDPRGLWNPGKVIPEAGTGDPEAGDALESGDPAGRPQPLDRGAAGSSRDAVRHSPPDLTVTVAGDVRLDALAGALAARGQWLPVDLPGLDAWTVEALVQEAPVAPCAPALGGVRDHLLGARLETRTGRRLALGGRVMKNVAGLDLVRPVVGSRGRLGRVVEATFRLAPVPAARRELTWTGAAREMAAVARALATAPILPAGLVLAPAGPGDCWTVRARVLGSRSTVEAEATLLLAHAPGGEGDTGGAGAPWETPEELRDSRSEGAAASIRSRAFVEIRCGDTPLPEVARLLAPAVGQEEPPPGFWALPLWRVAGLPLAAVDGVDPVLRVLDGAGLPARVVDPTRSYADGGVAGEGLEEEGRLDEDLLARRVSRAVEGPE